MKDLLSAIKERAGDKYKVEEITILPIGIVNLDYSEKQRLFHYAEQKTIHKTWVSLKAMSLEIAIAFTDFMDKKYVNGRSSGILPELSIVKLELDLFFKLKNINRKLVDR